MLVSNSWHDSVSTGSPDNQSLQYCGQVWLCGRGSTVHTSYMYDKLVLSSLFLSFSHPDQASKKHPFPCPTTYRAALTSYVDISSCPRTHVLRELAEYASDPAQREFLLKITSPTDEGKVSTVIWLGSFLKSYTCLCDISPCLA